MSRNNGNEDEPRNRHRKYEKVHQLDRFDLLHNKEAMSYLGRIGAKPRGMFHAIVSVAYGSSGYYTDTAHIRFSREGEVKAPPGYEPTEAELTNIKAKFADTKWPERMPIKTIQNPHPNFLKTPEDKTFTYYNDEGYIEVNQLRFEFEENGVSRKIYVTYTYWSDGLWRQMEPDILPLWGLENYKGQAEVFIHEGAKAARHITNMIKNGSIVRHPWGEDLRYSLHIGWMGGALNPGRTDWKPIKNKNFSHAYIVLDRDDPGENALGGISKAIMMPATSIKFPDTFPIHFDMADKWPDKYFKNGIYNGPTIEQFSNPATWMTKVEKFMVRSKKGEGKRLIEKQKVLLSEHAKKSVIYLKDLERFMFVDDPMHVQHTASSFNKALAYLSDVKDIAELFIKQEYNFASQLTYDPTTNIKIINNETGLRLNLYRPSLIRPTEGNYEPFLEFMRHLIPVEPDRNDFERWLATLIARPDIRMRYATLLVSKRTGVGKTTLFEKIVIPLVGPHNCSFPRENQLDGEFNGWVANKRFAYVAEIDQGHNYRIAQTLKSFISDSTIRVNNKYEKEFEVPNWCHFGASSNSLGAIRIDGMDRRWHIPMVTEERWSEEKFNEFYRWLSYGGLRIIRYWANRFENYVKTGEHAPMTNRKYEVIHEGKSQGYVMAEGIGNALKNKKEPFIITDVDLYAYITNVVRGRMYDSKLTLRTACCDGGGRIYSVYDRPQQVSIGGRVVYAICNDAAIKAIDDRLGEAGVIQLIYRGSVGGVKSLLEDDM